MKQGKRVPKTNSKQKKFRNDRFAKKMDEESTAYGKAPYNDISWYIVNEQVLNDVARIPYSYPVGVPYERLGNFDSTGLIDAAQLDYAVPGILTAWVMPTIGNAKYANDAVNVAANGIYTYVRHLNSGSRNYDAPDLMIYVMAVDSLYTMMHWAMRLYGTLTMYSQANRYVPRALVESQMVDFDDLLLNAAQFRAGLNMRIPRIASLAVPSVLPIFQRHMWLFDNYYIEGPSEKDQIYMYTLAGCYVFRHDSDGAGMLDALRFNKKMTVSDIFYYLDLMMDAIFADEDFNIMSGDVYKAYQGNVMQLGPIPDNYMLPLNYNEEVLLQFKNLKCKDVYSPASDPDHWIYDFFKIHQSVNKDYLITETPDQALMNFSLVQNGQINHVYVDSTSTAQNKQLMVGIMNEYSKSLLLTSPHAVVEPKENMVNSRCSLAIDWEYDSSDPLYHKLNNTHFASEWPLGVTYSAYHKWRGSGVVNLYRWEVETAMAVTSADVRIDWAFKSMIPVISAFKYHPEIQLITVELTDLTDPSTWHIVPASRTLFEVDNYTYMDHAVIGRLHDTAIMGMYDIPRVAYDSSRR